MLCSSSQPTSRKPCLLRRQVPEVRASGSSSPADQVEFLERRTVARLHDAGDALFVVRCRQRCERRPCGVRLLCPCNMRTVCGQTKRRVRSTSCTQPYMSHATCRVCVLRLSLRGRGAGRLDGKRTSEVSAAHSRLRSANVASRSRGARDVPFAPPVRLYSVFFVLHVGKVVSGRDARRSRHAGSRRGRPGVEAGRIRSTYLDETYTSDKGRLQLKPWAPHASPLGIMIAASLTRVVAPSHSQARSGKRYMYTLRSYSSICGVTSLCTRLSIVVVFVIHQHQVSIQGSAAAEPTEVLEA